MKKYLFPLLAALTLTVGAARAQTTTPMQDGSRPQRSPEQMAARQAERMTQGLGLSADQTTRVQKIMAARGQEMQAMRGQMQSGTVNRDQMREQMQANRAKYDAQFKEVLTADQYAKFTTMEAERMQRGRGGRGPGQDSDDKSKVKVKGDKLKVKPE